MAIRDAVPAVLCALLCVLAMVAPVAATPEGSAAGPGVEPLVQQGVVPDSTRITVDIRENGSAHWQIQYWTRLDDQNTTEAFDSLSADISDNPDNYTADFRDRIEGTVSAAENSTGRDMAVSNVSVSADTRSLPDSYGVVTYSFEWSNFAAVDGDRLVVGDAIEGFFLDSDSRLMISWPESYGSVSVAPSPDETRENTVIWRGSDTEFVSGEPRVVLEPGAGSPATATTTDDTPGGDGNVADDPFPTTTALGGLVVVGLLLGGGVLYARSRGVFGDDSGANVDTEPVSERGATGTAAATAESDESADSTTETASDDSGADQTPAELLSNEERVLQFIESQGGRVKQQEVAGALDWTDAKTSKVVRGMRDEGTIEGFRLGRENVLRLPEEDEDESADGRNPE
ncbi:DUF4897 domain-containing protein [Haloferax namakaokahaiae]|uniref:DUF4897 domain-containing protein n=1 Tax=Haloferax namakaokahaiae TaxID=1748331 RepID=A0ABD5ZCK5_9EURY